VYETNIYLLLQDAFTLDEFEYLKRLPDFQKLMKQQDPSTEDFDHLIGAGQLLLQQKKDLSPN